jgi:hypothetical protein
MVSLVRWPTSATARANSSRQEQIQPRPQGLLRGWNKLCDIFPPYGGIIDRD